MSDVLELTMEDTPLKRQGKPDLYSAYGVEVLGMPAGWHWLELSKDAPDGWFKLRGAVAPLKRNGEPNWRKKDPSTDRTFFVESAVFVAWQEERARNLGVCPDCYGSGEVQSGWSAASGPRFRPCARCETTGEYRTPTNITAP